MDAHSSIAARTCDERLYLGNRRDALFAANIDQVTRPTKSTACLCQPMRFARQHMPPVLLRRYVLRLFDETWYCTCHHVSAMELAAGNQRTAHLFGTGQRTDSIEDFK